jgi:hypothetical protein
MPAAALASLAVAACGGSVARDESPEAVVREFLAAKRAADGARMCALYGTTYRDEIERDPDNERHLSCEGLAVAYARAYRDEDNTLTRVEVSGDQAVATVSCEDPSASDCSLPLIEEDGRWRIAGSLSPND